jgi:hypothetical protein
MPTVKSGFDETTVSQMKNLGCYRCNDVLSTSPLEHKLSEGLSVKTALHLARLNRILDLKANS